MRQRGKSTMTAAVAEAIAARALLFLAEDDRRLVRFLSDTGLDPATLKSRMGSPELLASVLGHLLGDESLLLVFTAGANIDPMDIGSAHSVLEAST